MPSNRAIRATASQSSPLVDDELRRLATYKLAREHTGKTLQATALVHEAYLRLGDKGEAHSDSRGDFFAAAAEAMCAFSSRRPVARDGINWGAGTAWNLPILRLRSLRTASSL